MCVRWQIGFAVEYEDLLINYVLMIISGSHLHLYERCWTMKVSFVWLNVMEIDIDAAIGDSSDITA